MSDDNVLELLDSIDKPKQGKRKDRKPKKRHNEDLMDFLDEIASEGTPSGTPRKGTPVPADEQKATSSTSPPPTHKETPDSKPTETTGESEAPREPLPDPIGAVSSWWSKAKPGLWEQATKAAHKASELRNEHVRNFDLGSIQKSLSTFVETIVPPISRHEQLTIHVFHDMAGYPVVDDIVRTVFQRVMEEVEGGGELNMVVQKGIDKKASGSGARNLNLFEGTVENAKKLCIASIEDFRRDHATPPPDGADGTDNGARLSEVFISVQAALVEGAEKDNQFEFVCCLSDFTNNVHLTTTSQGMPAEWAKWLDAGKDEFSDAIADPRDWVLEWTEEALSLSLGTLAQKYVLLRMGLSEGSKVSGTTESKKS